LGAVPDNLSIQEDQWHTIVYTYDGTVSKLYVNGALVNTNIKTATFNPNPNNLFIGKNEGTIFPYYFQRAIDEIGIYNKAIPDQKIGYLNILRTKYLKVANKIIY
jgi:hypothetical protein